MKINVIGGGPAGLYFALLMKKSEPGHEIAVIERNAPDSTFGWGVVFSAKTLSYLKAQDDASYEDITNRFQLWDNVDVVHRDDKITIRGNSFAGISRIDLLNILQQRCRALGIDLRFNTEVSDVKRLADECDLLVGADGVNSTVRQAWCNEFQPTLAPGSNRYIWYGTHQLFHGLTLTFREAEAGVFAAHSYKFNNSTSTFIVECEPSTWTSAGFETMSAEDTQKYLADIFARDLGGHALLSNNSKWLNFIVVRNRRWVHDNVVLLGDALHTAHFSIGSGTKLALEDSMALHESFQRNDSVETSLGDFERARKPVIEAYQEAANESLIWFENISTHITQDPLILAYKLMTRSKKIDHENLRKRDPQFIAAYDAATHSTRRSIDNKSKA